MRISPRFAWQLVRSEAIILDVTTGRAVGLNETGSFIWSRLEAREEAEIARELAREFRLDEDSARADVRGFIELLTRENFLQQAP